ncbi:hypothetical protein AB0O31_02600 [Kitasatospora cineracea]|uniref:ATP-grasp domain-containing protein n=1 Tax=Kitasatospora cineracea TaxID=88074 RepID=UPI00342C4CB7
MAPAKPHLGVITPRQYTGGETGVHDEGPYSNQHIVAEDVVWDGTPGGFTYRGTDLRGHADAFLVHFAFSGDPMDGFLATLARALESARVPLLNSSEHTWVSGDKFLALQKARGLGIATPRTLLARPARENLESLVTLVEREFAYPFVLKPRGTMMGFAVVKVTDRDLLVSTLQLFSATAMSCLVQEFVPTDGREIRCLYVGGELLGAYERSNPAGFLTNATPRAGHGTGTTVTRLAPTAPGLPALLDQGALLLDGLSWDLAAIDWFRTESGYVLNEINPVPGSSSIPAEDRLRFDERLAAAIRHRIDQAATAA